MLTIELVEGDCVLGLLSSKRKKYDLVVTSPPYNAGKQYWSVQEGEDRQPRLEQVLDLRKEVRWFRTPFHGQSWSGSLLLRIVAIRWTASIPRHTHPEASKQANRINLTQVADCPWRFSPSGSRP